MTSSMGEQMTLQDLGIASMKTCQEHSQAIKTNSEVEKTSVASLRNSPRSSKKTFAFLDLRENGHTAEASSWITDRLLGLSWMPNTMVRHNVENEFVSYATSTDLLHQGFCLTLNLSEHPRTENPSLLSEVLEEEADERYNLSSKACRGILNRANKRGKKLPEVLEDALKAQITDEEDG